MNFTILVWLYCLRILASCKNFNFSSWERSSSHVLTVIPILCFNVPLNVSSKFPLPSNYDSFMTETEKVVATHSSTFSWKIPWLEEPGGLQSMGSLRVGHDSVTSLSLCLRNNSKVIVWQRNMQLPPLQSVYTFSLGHQSTKTTVKRQDDLVWEVLGLLREGRECHRT